MKYTIDSFPGFFKVAQSGGSYVTATLYNPTTGEDKIVTVRDYDYADCSRDNDEVYNTPINDEVRRVWLHKGGHILVGDTVEVVKGRKVKVGTIAIVKEIRPYYDRYGRWVADYLYFTDGQRTNINNCKMYAIA